MSAEFSVPLADLESGPKWLRSPLELKWLAAALAGSGAEARGPGRLDVELSRSGREVMVRGELEVPLTMPCVRTLDPVAVDVATEVFLLLERAPDPPRGDRKLKARPGAAGERAQNTKKAAKEPERELSSADSARDVFCGDDVVLDEFIREFILLELPMAPLREDLRSDEAAASTPPSPRPVEPAQQRVDPRLAPLEQLRNRLKKNQE